MYDLKFDTDVMEATIKEYEEIHKEIETTKDLLTKDLEALKDTYWQTEAGKIFYDKYNDDWVDNVKNYLIIIEFLKDQLKKAKGQYETIHGNAEKIRINL